MRSCLISSTKDWTGLRPSYWDQVLSETQQRTVSETWYAYMRGVYADLVQAWLPDRHAAYGLKTDLFEEAVSAQAVLPELGIESIGIDCSLVIAQTACERLQKTGRRHQCIVGDLRQLPFRSGTLPYILAGSSLDHFPDKTDIATSLAELEQALSPGGVLVVTFDNPHNPLVWLRNCLPFRLLNRLGLVPYYTGETYRRCEARQQLEALGLQVTHLTAVAHVPRALAIWLAKGVDRLGWEWLSRWLERLFHACERLAEWPSRYQTGYYLALRAEKRQGLSPLLGERRKP